MSGEDQPEPMAPNALARLLPVLERAGLMDRGKTLKYEAWGEVLGIEPGADQLERVTSALLAMREQIKESASAASRTRHKRGVWQPAIDSALQAVSTGNLSGHWNEAKGALPKHYLDVLHMLADSLPDEESEAGDELSEFSRRLADLRAVLDEGGLPQDIAYLLKRLLARMQRAIDEYEFRGPQGIVAALNEVQTEAAFNQPRLATVASSPAMVAFRRAVAAGAVTVSVVLNVAHLLQGGDSIAKIAADTYHGWQQIGSGGAKAPAQRLNE